jgi:hypothetical protein
MHPELAERSAHFNVLHATVRVGAAVRVGVVVADEAAAAGGGGTAGGTVRPWQGGGGAARHNAAPREVWLQWDAEAARAVAREWVA